MRRRPSSTCRTAGRHAVGDAAAVPGARRRAGRDRRRGQPHQLGVQYSYHHGFYDGVEREFRGFARVDAARHRLAAGASRVSARSPRRPTRHRRRVRAAACADANLVPHRRVLRRATTSPPARCASTAQLDPQRRTPAADDPARRARAPEELREACRALRGRVLRQEVYAQDGTAQRVNPYTTTEHRYQVDHACYAARDRRSSMAACTGLRGVLSRRELESCPAHYERDPRDPRVSHELTLAVDAYGNITRHAAVGYPRRCPRPEQAAHAGQLHRARLSPTSPISRLVPARPADRNPDLRAHRHGAGRRARPVRRHRPAGRGQPPPRPISLRSSSPPRDTAAEAAVRPHAHALPRRRPSGSLALARSTRWPWSTRTYQLRVHAGPAQPASSARRLHRPTLTVLLAGSGGFVDLDGDGNHVGALAADVLLAGPGGP